MIRCFRFSLLAFFAFSVLALTACGPTNYVRLQYASEVAPAHMQPNAPTVTVIEFTDARSSKDVGVRKDDTPFLPVSSVTAWVSEAMKEELSRKGLNTRYVRTADDVVPGEHVITGTVQKVWLRQKNLSEYTVAVELAVAVDGNLPITYRSEQERQDIPTSDVTEKQLTEALRTLLINAVDDIMIKLQPTAE